METKAVLLLGNCLDQLKQLPDSSIDSVVTDPPYGLSFMGKKWDYDVPSTEIWREVMRVLKPGGHMLAACGTRTQHRMVVNIEDAGFEVRDVITWHYGSGFPKSHNVEKATSDSRFAGVGTALKPATEFWTLARKPIEGTVAANVLKYGTGGLNIDATRIATDDNLNGGAYALSKAKVGGIYGKLDYKCGEFSQPQGRFPANVIFDEYTAGLLDEQSGILKSGGGNKRQTSQDGGYGGGFTGVDDIRTPNLGGASRFFYVAKASKKDRGADNNHPTVKPTKLMEYLVQLITPAGGIVLDPFMGSGSTGVAAVDLGYKFVGCEMDEAYFEICRKRIHGKEG